MAQLKPRLKTVSIFSTLFIFLFFFVSVLSDDPDERSYMLRLRKALTPTPSGWSSKTDICSWTGVDCDIFESVTAIKLSSMSLRGILPSGLNDSLFSLAKLYLYNNSLFGPLPSLANLQNLQDAYVSENKFTSIPEGCFQGLDGLQVLFLAKNLNLTPWEFPVDLSQSPVLKATNLMGSLPDIFDSFPNLHSLYLHNNSLSGVLPKSLAHSKISFLMLSDQSDGKLSGTIEILSSMANLFIVRLMGNSFEGPIPDLCNCTSFVKGKPSGEARGGS